MCYKDGPHLPPLNITIVCVESGRYVIFYNERLNGVTYPTGYVLENVFTELCEVVVQGKKIKMLSQAKTTCTKGIASLLHSLAPFVIKRNAA